MQKTILSAVEETITSVGENIENLDNLTLQVIAASITSGNGVFTVDGSNDGKNWVTGIAMLDVTATATGTYVVSKTLSANGSGALRIPTGFKMIRVKATVTTDGSYTAILHANKKTK